MKSSISYKQELERKEKVLKKKISDQEQIVYQEKLTPDWMEQYEKLNLLRHDLKVVKDRLYHKRQGKPALRIEPYQISNNQISPAQ